MEFDSLQNLSQLNSCSRSWQKRFFTHISGSDSESSPAGWKNDSIVRLLITHIAACKIYLLPRDVRTLGHLCDPPLIHSSRFGRSDTLDGANASLGKISDIWENPSGLESRGDILWCHCWQEGLFHKSCNLVGGDCWMGHTQSQWEAACDGMCGVDVCMYECMSFSIMGWSGVHWVCCIRWSRNSDQVSSIIHPVLVEAPLIAGGAPIVKLSLNLTLGKEVWHSQQHSLHTHHRHHSIFIVNHVWRECVPVKKEQQDKNLVRIKTKS